MGQPEVQQAFSTVSVDGFDDVFVEAVASPAQAVPDPTVEAVASPAQIVPDHPSDGISLEEASQLLGLHIDTIKKRLRKGTLPGFKVTEKYGDKWLVSRAALPSPVEAVASPAQAVPDHTFEAVASPAQVVPDHTFEAVASPTQTVPDHRLIEVIENQAHQLKAAGDVIMYLRSQIEEKDTQLKLLTDSQHKSGWWARFGSWFIGHK